MKFLTTIFLLVFLYQFSKAQDWYSKSEMAFKDGQYSLCISYANKCIEINCNDKIDKVYDLLAGAYFYTNDYAMGIVALSKAININKTNDELYRKRGLCYYNLKGMNFPKALSDFQKSISLNPDNSKTYSNLSEFYYYTENYDKAIEASSTAIYLDSLDAHAYYFKGISYMSKNKFQECINNLNKALLIEPNYTNALGDLSLCYYNLKDYQKSLMFSNKALSVDNKNSTLYLNRAQNYIALNQNKYAINALDSAIFLNPLNTKAMNTLGWVYLNMNDNDRALLNFAKAAILEDSTILSLEQTPYPYLNTGIVLVNIGRYKEALDAFKYGEEIAEENEIKLDYYIKYKVIAQQNLNNNNNNPNLSNDVLKSKNYCNYGENNKGIEICNTFQINATLNSFSSNTQALKSINLILQPLGLVPNFVLVPCDNINNCCALTYSRVRYIFYDPAFLKKIQLSANTDWTSISILAHELAHHLDGHTLDSTDISIKRLYELEADEFSGYILGILGATLTQAQAAMKTVSHPSCDNEFNSDHPCLEKRLQAIKKGWDKSVYNKNGIENNAQQNNASNPQQNKTISNDGSYSPALTPPNQNYKQQPKIINDGSYSPTLIRPY